VDFDGPLLAGRFRLGPTLGEGGQGKTFVARDERDGGRVVVVKAFTLAGQSWKKFDLFEREVRVLKALSHPGIPAYLDTFESEPPGTFYLVMERAPGAPLAGRRFDEAALVALLVKALVVLAYLHEQSPPVIHRDVKPANLVLADDGRLWLVDFGGVRAAMRGNGGSTVVGTFGYMAPEQLHGQATPATDVYGLGATIVALAGGVEPEDVPRKGLRMDLRRHLPQLSPWFLELLEKMTDPDPETRPQSAREVLRLVGARGRNATGALATVASPRRSVAGPRAQPPVPPTPPTPPAPPASGPAREELQELAQWIADPDVPGPVRALARVLLWIIGTGGWMGLAVVQATLVPLIFAIVSAFARGESQKQVDETRAGIDSGLREARRELRALADVTRRSRKALPPAE
jgi:serine/threonine protein kinase